MKNTRKRSGPSIETFKGGVRIIGLRGSGKGNDLPAKRGEIKGWSKDSRKRMRDYLLTHQPLPGMKSYGVTFTIPGPAIEPENARRLWDHFAKNYLVRNGCGAVWRLEIQSRGAAHWHCLMSAPSRIEGVEIEKHIREWWLKALDILPPWYIHRVGDFMDCREQATPGCIRHKVEPENPVACQWWDVSREPSKKAQILPDSLKHLQGAMNYLQGKTVLFGHGFKTVMNRDDLEKVVLSKWPGAWHYAVDVQGEGGRGAWLRYLQDHATKAKQEQIAQGFGRHWGVVGRAKFAEQEPDGEMVFSCRESYFRFWRAYHRLTQPVISYRLRRENTGAKFASRIFDGRSLGWSSSRGIYGTSVWFSKAATVQRLWEWAESL